MQQIKLMLADDHELIRSGIRLLLQDRSDISVVAEAKNGAELLAAAKETTPDLVLMDIEMPGATGLEVAGQLLEMLPQIGIILLTMYTESSYLERCLEIGCRGYLLKQSDTQEIIEAIHQVHAGEVYIGGGASRHFLKRSLTQNGISPTMGKSRLSKREIEVLCLIAEGLASKDIADKLFISVRTVDTHRSNILHKLELSNTAQLVRFAIKNRLVELP